MNPLEKPPKPIGKFCKHFKLYTLECKLHTGRTHQIRVHLSSIGMPLLGDKTYGKQKPSLLQNFDDTQKQMITNFPR